MKIHTRPFLYHQNIKTCRRRQFCDANYDWILYRFQKNIDPLDEEQSHDEVPHPALGQSGVQVMKQCLTGSIEADEGGVTGGTNELDAQDGRRE